MGGGTVAAAQAISSTPAGTESMTFLLSLAQIMAGIGLFAAGQERRAHFWWRLVGVVATFCLLYAGIAGLLLRDASRATRLSQSPVFLVVLFATILAYAVLALPLLYDMPLWTSLFCCTAGYTVQNLASGTDGLVRLVAQAQGMPVVDTPGVLLSMLGATAAVYPLCWWLYARPARRMGLVSTQNREIAFSFMFVVMAVIAFDVANKQLPLHGVPLATTVTLRVVHGAVCLFSLGTEVEILLNTRLQVEAATSARMAAERERQWEQSQKNVEAINLKCHDIRHQIRNLQAGGAAVDKAVLDDIAREVNVYDSKVRTGNAALDTILSEKGLVCERAGIAFTCIADGAALGFMTPADLYSLFGNATENAIEATSRVPDADRRSIGIDVRMVAGMARIHVENSFVGGLEMGSDGLPRTSKGDTLNHGFGMRSMRAVADRYGGTLTTRVVGDVFHLNVLLPVPEGAEAPDA